MTGGCVGTPHVYCDLPGTIPILAVHGHILAPLRDRVALVHQTVVLNRISTYSFFVNLDATYSVTGVNAILLMGPPGSGKSTLGHELNRQGLATYTELEPLIVEVFGSGESFVPKRPQAHRWIRDFYRQQLRDGSLPIVIETTGIGDRAFLEELAETHSVVLVMLDTPRDVCLDRLEHRPKGRHVGAPGKPAAQFHDDWHSQTKPTYEFHLSVSGTDLERAVRDVHATLDALDEL